MRLKQNFLIAVFALIGGAAAAQSPALTCATDDAVTCTVGDRVIYLPRFFDQFNPVTALDMVRRVPGFTIDAGDAVRGFGGAAGNVLIDGERPSTKSADIEDTLSRIGAGAVERIELIRGGTGGLDVGGRSVVVNVVRKAGGEGGDQSLWNFVLLKRRPDGGLRPNGSVSLNGRAGAVKFSLGANVSGISLRYYADEEITRFFGADETRLREGALRDAGGGVNLKLERPIGERDVARFSFESAYERQRDALVETRFLAGGAEDLAIFTTPEKDFSYELGADYEHSFSESLNGKLIALFSRSSEDSDRGFDFIPETGVGRRSVFSSAVTGGETIGRVEFGWSGWRGHAIQFGGEFAKNFIDSTASLIADDGSGVFLPVPIDGANTRVVELRGEPFLNDSWKASDRLTFDLGFAVELSRIAQSGDSANSRFFVYPKPSLKATFAASPKQQWRISAARTVNQLDFDEFVSAVNFDDEDVDFGNPELRPQRVWDFSLTYERRFGDIGVAELTGFYKYVQDVEDLLPIGGIVEVPGNIGDGKIYGGTFKLTAPLGWLYLKNARIESDVTVRRSSVTDPVTGLDRRFSFTPDILYNLNFRQDFVAEQASWGFYFGRRSVERGFGLDEITAFRNQTEINAFVETTKIKGVKVRFEMNDIINVESTRDRTVFMGSRANDIALFREFRRSTNGGAFRLGISGAF